MSYWIVTALTSILVAAMAMFYQRQQWSQKEIPQISKSHKLSSSSSSASSSSPSSSSSSSSSSAVYVIGDLHGDDYCAQYWVEKTGLIHREGNQDNKQSVSLWRNKNNSLVFMGDYIDKGPRSKQTLEYVKYLTELFPSHVHALLGNHEIELLRDRSVKIFGGTNGAPSVGYFQLGYSSVHPGEYLNFLNEEDVDQTIDTMVVEALYNATLEAYGLRQHRSLFILPENTKGSILTYIPQKMQLMVKNRLEIYQQRYLDAFRNGSVLGTWLEQRPVAVVLGDTLFVHGGVRPEVGKLLRTVKDVEWINQQLAMHAQEDRLHTFLTATQPGQMVYSLLTYRGNHEAGACAFLSSILPRSVQRLAVGHTPSGSVRLQCQNKFLALDSSLSRWFRNSGNEYCQGDSHQLSSNGMHQCPQKSEQCQGQIVRISDGIVETIA